MDWITYRLPTEADAYPDGGILVKQLPGSDALAYFHWSFVKPGMAWRRTAYRSALQPADEPAPEPVNAPEPTPTSQPRRIVSITLDADSVAAVADDGTAWWLSGDGTKWTQLPALPQREIE